MSCGDCGKPLNMLESYYYETRCEDCERAHHERLTAWRKGDAREPELDAFYSAPPALTKEPSDGE